MDVIGHTRSLTDIDPQALAVAVFKGEKADAGLLKTLNAAIGGSIAEEINSEEFAGKENETAYFHVNGAKLKFKRLLLVGCGERDAYKSAQVTQMAGTSTRFLRGKNVQNIAIAPRSDGDAERVAQTVVVGGVMGLFEPDKYRTKDKEKREIKSITVVIEDADKKAVQRGADRGLIIGESINFTRDMANEPGGYMTPTIMADRAKKVAKEFGLSIDVIDQKQMEKLGMGSLLGVARGSDEPPKLIIMKYQPSRFRGKQNGLLALVGKGVTFDSGGISLKPGENMELMKYDMTGAATVIGTMRAIAQLKPSIPVLGVAPCTENLPSGKATKPGDVLRAMTGKTIEVINTDAEGRLILADAIAYAKKLGATKIIDMATLTGAVSIALGDVHTAILGTDQELINEVIASGVEVGEKFWQLPLDKEYTNQIKSDIADIKNVGGKKAGTITAAAFLKEFSEETPWAHLDIAGTAWGDPATSFRSKGPTGIAVRTLIEFIERSARQ
ncbi:MAG TPA: leucyl aminopeptidase [Pyrinomonadaceae bacterium]|nr:leucyl aminopeptidase [Pyrinomonadaceae bacterium]